MDDALRCLADQIIAGLNLEEISADDIDPDAPLFGDGLGLDSIDALELALVVDRNYNIKISDAAAGRAAFASLRTLHDYIAAQRPQA